MHRIGIDMGGTKIEGIVLDADLKPCARERIPTEQSRGYEPVLDSIAGLYRRLKEPIGDGPHTFGIGTPGAVSKQTGLLSLSNTVCMNGKPVKADLERWLKRPIAIQNDANCFAEAEAVLGAGKGYDLVFGVIMGTGCGGGIVYKGEVLTGLQSRGGEWGHMSLDPNGPPCYCGQMGCVETYISGGGLERRYERTYGHKRPLKEVVDAFRLGEPRAVEFLDVFFDDFGRSLANIITVLDPDIIVLGGGVSKMKELYTEGVSRIGKFISMCNPITPVVQHKLGDSAGVIGAALIGI